MMKGGEGLPLEPLNHRGGIALASLYESGTFTFQHRRELVLDLIQPINERESSNF